MSSQDNPFAPASPSGFDGSAVAVPSAQGEPSSYQPPAYDDPSSAGAEDSGEGREISAFRDIGLVGIASLFLMAQTASECSDNNGCTGNMVWGLACSITATLLCSLYIFVMRFGPGRENPAGYAKWTPILACTLLAMYTAGAGLLTFDGPYVHTGNGYFFSWAAFLLSGHAVYVSIDWLHGILNRSTMDELASLEKQIVCGCIIFSLIQFIQSSVTCSNHDCSGKVLFGVICGLIALVWCFGLFFLLGKLTHLPQITGLLALFLGVSAAVLTFSGGPYSVTGNGYFGAWGSFSFAAGLCFLTSRHLIQKEDDLRGGTDQGPTGSADPYPSQAYGSNPALPPPHIKPYGHDHQPHAQPSAGNAAANEVPQIPASGSML